MVDQEQLNAETLNIAVKELIATHRRSYIIAGIALIVLGFFAAVMPLISTLAVEIFIGWCFIASGIFRTVMLIRAKRLPGFLWSLVAALMAIVLGILLVAEPLQGILTLTLVLMFLFLIEGVSAILTALSFRQHLSNWGWLLLGGTVNLVLVFLIWQDWPASASWVIGLLTGINLAFLGFSLLTIAFATGRMK